MPTLTFHGRINEVGGNKILLESAKARIFLNFGTYDGVLLNHAHADHCSYIHFLRKDIPIYCSEESSLIMKALEDTSSTGFLDLLNLKQSFKFKPQKRDPTKFSKIKGEEPKIERNVKIFN